MKKRGIREIQARKERFVFGKANAVRIPERLARRRWAPLIFKLNDHLEIVYLLVSDHLRRKALSKT